MGLDTTHNAWHGPYSSFHQWRIWLASKIGIQLESMAGFSEYKHNMVGKEWESLTKDDLHLLLNHSDCDGILTPDECGKIAKRLSDILEHQVNKNDQYYGVTKQFLDGCLLAQSKNESIEFH